MANTELQNRLEKVPVFDYLKHKFADKRRRKRVSIVAIGGLLVLPLIIPEFWSFLISRYMLFGLLALSLGLIWGFAGILSFGQAAFFGIGAYTMALSYDYISVVNPAYVAIVATIVGTGTLAYIFGWIYFNADVIDDYFVIVTLALPVILQQLVTTFSDITGGFEGTFLMRMDLTVPGVTISMGDDRIFYYIVLLTLIASYLACRKLLNTHFGSVLIGIRENEVRTRSLGYDTSKYKTIVFTLSAMLAGIAGALYAQLTTFVTPELIGFMLSTEVVIWTVLGGRGLLIGAITGGAFVGALSNQLNQLFPQTFLFILGVLFIIIVVLFPKGIVGNIYSYLNNGDN